MRVTSLDPDYRAAEDEFDLKPRPGALVVEGRRGRSIHGGAQQKAPSLARGVRLQGPLRVACEEIPEAS
jgi:hypothetical protein